MTQQKLRYMKSVKRSREGKKEKSMDKKILHFLYFTFPLFNAQDQLMIGVTDGNAGK